MKKILLMIALSFSSMVLANEQVFQEEDEWVRYTTVCSYTGFNNLFPLSNENQRSLYPGMNLRIFGDSSYIQVQLDQNICKDGAKAPCFNEGKIEFTGENNMTITSSRDDTKSGWGTRYTDWSYQKDGPYLLMRPNGISMQSCPGAEIIIIFEKVTNSFLLS